MYGKKASTLKGIMGDVMMVMMMMMMMINDDDDI